MPHHLETGLYRLTASSGNQPGKQNCRFPGDCYHSGWPMSIYDIKPAFQDVLRPVTRWLAASGVTPNRVTFAAFALSCAAGATMFVQSGARWTLFLIPAVLFVRMALNAIDGMLAREHDMRSARGVIWNELGDVLSDAALYLPLALVDGVPAIPIVLFVVLAIVSEMAGVLAVMIGAGRRYDGPMGKSDRAVAISLFALFLAIGVEPGWWCEGFLWLCFGLLILTTVRRVRSALKEIAP